MKLERHKKRQVSEEVLRGPPGENGFGWLWVIVGAGGLFSFVVGVLGLDVGNKECKGHEGTKRR